MKFAVVGAGAIGGWLAARLALAGEEVSVLAHGATLQRLRTQGLELHSARGVEQARPRASDSPAELGAHDVVLLAVKGHALPALAPTLRPLLGERTQVVGAGNGLPWWYFLAPHLPCAGLRLRSVDPEGTIESAFAGAQVGALSVFASCECPAPGVVRHNAGNRLVLGAPSDDARWVDELAQRLRSAGFDAQHSPDIRRDVWLKLLGNACFNPVSLLTQATTDEMIDTPELHELFVAMMNEAIGVGGRLGLDLRVDPVERVAQARTLGRIRTSMLQDLEAGRTVELEPILGALVECAAAVAMPVPTLSRVLALARLRARAQLAQASDFPGHGNLPNTARAR